MFSARRLKNIRKGPVTQFNIDSQMTHCTRQMIQYGGGMKQLRVLHGTEAGKKDTYRRNTRVNMCGGFYNQVWKH